MPNNEIVKVEPNKIYAPSYGTVRYIKQKKNTYHISIFLGLFDVHIQYAPVSGIIKSKTFVKGDHHYANDNQSDDNTHLKYIIEMDDGREIELHQISGIIARKIVSFKNIGDTIRAGEEIGFIRFGSRVDIIIPNSSKILIVEGQKLYGSNTVVAEKIIN